MQSPFAAMTDSGVRLESVALFEPHEQGRTRAQDVPHAVQAQSLLLQQMLENGCCAGLRSLQLNVALDSFWYPEESLNLSTFTFGLCHHRTNIDHQASPGHSLAPIDS